MARVYELAERIRSEVERLNISHRRSEYGRVTINLGLVSKVPEQDELPCTFLEMADQAYTNAKKREELCFLFPK